MYKPVGLVAFKSAELLSVAVEISHAVESV
jgi:hypothetical protein